MGSFPDWNGMTRKMGEQLKKQKELLFELTAWWWFCRSGQVGELKLTKSPLVFLQAREGNGEIVLDVWYVQQVKFCGGNSP